MKQEKNITVVFSSHLTDRDDENFINSIKQSCGLPYVEILCYKNNNEYSLSEVYNRGLKESSNNIVVFTHNDIIFETKNWGKKLLKYFEKYEDYGVLGLAGTKYLSNTGTWWDKPATMYGIVNHKQGDKKWTSKYSNDRPGYIDDVVIVDGLFFVVNKEKIKHNFDETFKGFHFYDLAFCFPNYLDKVKIGVVTDLRVTHLSIGQTNQQWEDNRVQFVNKYEKDLGVDINIHETETYVMVHNQDIIIKYEEEKKFNDLKPYYYVFLGDGETDKIENLSNIYLCKNYEYNLEKYPKLCAYSGWYFLYKNNIIKSKYVNLFEYDINLINKFNLHTIKHKEEKLNVISYNPFSTSNYHFINNPDWVKVLFEKIKNIYKIDMKNIIEKSGLQYWMATSNITLSNDFFHKYMKWCEPIINEMKEEVTVGHALERLLTFYCVLYKEKFYFVPNILEHFQMDSHKTQGHTVTHKII